MNEQPTPGAIRRFLTTSFDDERLVRLCYEYYPAVYDRFTADTQHLRKANALVVYCQRKNILPRLLQRIGPIPIDEPIEPASSAAAQAAPPSGGRSSPTATGPAPNPFGLTGRITDPDQFYDREDLLHQIFEELHKGVNLSLVGETQVGKSSLLEMVRQLGPDYLLPSTTGFAYLSLQWIHDENDFYEALCDALGVEAARGFKLFRALRGKHFILCLDEIEKMAWAGFTVRLRSQLRGLADGADAPLKLVIASRSPLSSLFPDSPGLDSPLAGICHQLDIGPFSLEITRQFLTHRLQKTGVTFTGAQMDDLFQLTGGCPAKLQHAAADLYRRLTQAVARTP